MSEDVVWVEDEIPHIDICTYMSFERLKKTVEEIQELINDGEWKDVYFDRKYWDDSSYLYFRGKRPETEQEKIQRLKQEKKAVIAAEKAKKIREENERKEYERLKKKFEK